MSWRKATQVEKGGRWVGAGVQLVLVCCCCCGGGGGGAELWREDFRPLQSPAVRLQQHDRTFPEQALGLGLACGVCVPMSSVHT